MTKKQKETIREACKEKLDMYKKLQHIVKSPKEIKRIDKIVKELKEVLKTL